MNRCKFISNVYNITLICIFFCTAFCNTFLEANNTNLDSLNERISQILKNPSLKNVSYGINVVSVKKNISVFHYRNNDLFSIASNMKLLTTSAALDYLGPDFKYTTCIEAYGIITTTGELNGDIVVRGSGDPNLSGRFYNGNILAIPESWATAIKNRGIHKITGDIIADDSIFDRVYCNPNWPENQLSEWYCAPSCGLSFNDNCVDITFVPQKKPGSNVTILLEPSTSYFTISNNCIYTSNKTEHAYSIFRRPGTNQIFIRGKYWINASPEKKWVSVHNPALYLATVFKEVLEMKGIIVCGNARLIRENEFINNNLERIAQTTSTMKQTILVTNKQSQNFYAEQIIKTLGAEIKGSGTLNAGIEVLQDFMQRLGFHQDEYQIKDGSGLSHGNKLSPTMITALLMHMSKHSNGKVLYDSLPVSGTDGGIKSRMNSLKYKNKIHAKTGYIAKTSALSGYIDTSNEDVLAFSILMNDFKNLSVIRKIQDDICMTLVDFYN